MVKIGIAVILISWLLDTLKDAIAFGNSSRNLKELWHAVKLISYLLPYGLIAYMLGLPWWLCLALIGGGYIIHEVGYRVFRSLDVWEWDRAFKCKWLRWIMLISNDRR